MTAVDTTGDTDTEVVPAKSLSADGPRLVAIRAELLPDEVVGARAVDRTRRRVLVGFVAVLALLVGLYGLSWWQTNKAQDELDGLQQDGTALQAQQQRYGPLVAAVNDTAAISAQLAKVMQGDLPWTAMLTTLRAQAVPAGVTLTAVSGTITVGTPGSAVVPGTTTTGGLAVLNRTGKQQVGTLVLQGGAKDKVSIARYVDRLGTVRGLAAPFVSNVTVNGTSITFSINVLITADALGGRFTAKSGGR